MAVVDPHYLWAVGHAVMLLCSIYILFQAIFFRTPAKVYKLAYFGALLSYAIVIFKSLGMPSANRVWISRAFADENFQYAVLAAYWFISKPINITVLPFATFSLFHCLTFLRTNILPKVASPPAAGAAQPGQSRPPAATDGLSRRIQAWVKNNYDPAMRFVAYVELVLFARVVFGAVTFSASFMAPLFLAHFIRLRYHASAFTRQAVSNITSRLDGVLLSRGGAVANGWSKAKMLIERWGGMGAPPQAAPPRPAAAAGAGTGARRP